MDATERNKATLRSMFAEVLEAPTLDEEAVARHFAPDYVQRVGGAELDHAHFIEHMNAQKSVIARTRIEIEHLVAEGDAVCSVHHVDATKHDGGAVEGHVIAHWTFDEDGLIVACNELTHMSVGSAEDRDLGSRV